MVKYSLLNEALAWAGASVDLSYLKVNIKYRSFIYLPNNIVAYEAPGIPDNGW